MGLLLWCLMRQGRGVRGPLRGRVSESAITANAACFATASPDAAGSPFFARSPPCATTSGSVALIASLAAKPALAPISIGGRPRCGSHCRDRYWSRPACRHWRCSCRQVPYPLPQPLHPSISLFGASLTHAFASAVLGRMVVNARKPVKPTQAGLP